MFAGDIGRVSEIILPKHHSETIDDVQKIDKEDESNCKQETYIAFEANAKRVSRKKIFRPFTEGHKSLHQAMTYKSVITNKFAALEEDQNDETKMEC